MVFVGRRAIVPGARPIARTTSHYMRALPIRLDHSVRPTHTVAPVPSDRRAARVAAIH